MARRIISIKPKKLRLRSVEVMIADLESGDPGKQFQACNELWKWKEEAAPAIPALVEIIQKKGVRPRIKGDAAAVLRAIGPQARVAVPLLLDLLRANEPWLSEGEVIYQGETGDPQITEVLHALAVLLTPEDTEALEVITPLLRWERPPGNHRHHFHSRVRAEAAYALCSLGAPGITIALSTVVPRLDSDDPEERRGAVSALHRMQSHALPAVEKLITMLQDSDEDPDIRHHVANTLSRIAPNSSAVKEALTALTTCENDKVSLGAKLALKWMKC